MSAPRPLICLTTSYPSGGDRAAGHFVKRLNDYYPRALWRIYVVCFDRSSSDEDRFEEEGVAVFRVKPYGQSLSSGGPDRLSASPVRHGLGLMISALRLNAAYKRVWRSLKAEYGDDPVVVAHWSLPSAWISRQHRPLVYCHGGDVALLESLPLGQRGRRALAGHIFTHTEGVVCVSADLSRRVCSLMAKARKNHLQSTPVFTLPMGIDSPSPCPHYLEELREVISSHKTPLPTQRNGHIDLLVISTVGRVVQIKGYDLLVEALGCLSSVQREQVLWLMAGDGEERVPLIKRASELGVQLVSLGHLAPKQRDALLSITDIFVAPSRQLGKRVEGSPLALREAALSGCALMATSCGGVGEILSELPTDLILEIEPTAASIHTHLCDLLDGQPRHHREERSKQRMVRRASELWLWSSLGHRHAALLSETR